MPASEVTESATPSLPADDFKAIFRGHPGGVSLITTDAGDGPVALTATSVASISVDPPLLDARTLHSREVITRLDEAFGNKLFEPVIKRTIKFADANVAAEPITSYAANHPGAEAHRNLARELNWRGGAP